MESLPAAFPDAEASDRPYARGGLAIQRKAAGRHGDPFRPPFTPPRVCTVFAVRPSKARKRLDDGPQRSSLFASWSNHIANSVNCVPETSRSATRTIVAVVMSFPHPTREIVTTSPSTKPTTVMSVPRA